MTLGPTRRVLPKGLVWKFLIRKDGTPVTNNYTVSISTVLDEESSAGETLTFFDRMVRAISCCRLLVRDRGVPGGPQRCRRRARRELFSSTGYLET